MSISKDITHSGYYIEIRQHSNDKVVDVIHCNTEDERQAQRIDDGLNINLSHQEYYTVLERA